MSRITSCFLLDLLTDLTVDGVFRKGWGVLVEDLEIAMAITADGK